MSDKLPANFDHERAGTEGQDHSECSNCHESPCRSDAKADVL